MRRSPDPVGADASFSDVVAALNFIGAAGLLFVSQGPVSVLVLFLSIPFVTVVHENGLDCEGR